MATKISPFKANYDQDPRMEFEGRRKREVQSSGKICRKNEENTGGSKSSTRKSTGENEEVCKQKVRRGRGVWDKELSTAKYEELEMADERKKIREVNRAFCGPLQSQGGCL